MPQVKILPGAVNEIIANVARTQTITKTDRYGIMAALLDESISDEDQNAINRLVRLIVRGKVQVVDEFSMAM